jgi:hypothetical protein
MRSGVVTRGVERRPPCVKVKHRDGLRRTRQVHSFVNYCGGELYGVHEAQVENVLRGVVERIFYVDYGEGLVEPIRPKAGAFTEKCQPALKFLRKHRRILTKISPEQFINSYRGNRKKMNRYTAAWESLLMDPLTRKDANIKTFVKAEKTNFSAKVDPCPRIISPRDPRYNLSLGVFTKPLEGIIYKLLDKMCGGTTVMKGKNAVEVGNAFKEMWDSFDDPVAVAVDAKRFDQHTHTEALSFEQRVYKMFFVGADLEELTELLDWQLSSDCACYLAEAIIKFIFAIRASGDMNTGLGTCIIMCCMVYSYFKSKKTKFRLGDNGDDGIIIVERRDLPVVAGFHEFCKELGYFMVMEEPVFKLERIEFCQAHPVWDGEGYRMVRNFPSSLTKDCTSLLPLNTEKAWKQWAHDIGHAGVALCAGIPVMQRFYERLRDVGVGSFGEHNVLTDTGWYYLKLGLESKTRPISEQSRVSFYDAFGVVPSDQIAAEEDLDKVVIDFSTRLVGHNINLSTKQHNEYSNQTLDNLVSSFFD